MRSEKKPNGRLALIWIALVLAFSAAAFPISGCLTQTREPSSSSEDSSSSEEDDDTDLVEEEPDETEDSSSEDEDPDKDESDDEDGKDSKPSDGSSGSTAAPSQTSRPSSQTQSPPSTTAKPSTTAPRPVTTYPSTTRPPATSTERPASSSASSVTDVEFSQSGTYSSSRTYRDGTIRNGGVILANKVFKGDLTISSRAAGKSIVLDNVRVDGTLYVEGGTDWLKLQNSQINKLVADKDSAKIFAYGKTDVNTVHIKEDATLYESEINRNSDGFENVSVVAKSGKQANVTLNKLSLGELETKVDSNINSDSDTVIGEVTARAPTYLMGNGEINKLVAYSNGVYYQNTPNKIYRDKNVDSPQYYDPDDDDDDNSNNHNSNKKDVWIDSIGDIYLDQDEDERITVNTNATKITATSDNKSVVTVKVSGKDIILTADRAGKARITVKGTRSNYNSDETYFDVEVESDSRDAPVIDDVELTTERWTNKNIDITFTVNDDDRDLRSVQVNGKSASRINGTSSKGGDYKYTVSSNGRYTITAKDSRNNEDEYTIKVENIDKTDPTVSSVTVQNANTVTSSKKVSFKAADAASGIKSVSVDQGIGTLTSSSSSYSFTATKAATYVITVVDNAGNTKTYRQTVNNIKVPDKPEIKDIEVSPQWTNGESVVTFFVIGSPKTITTTQGKTVFSLGNNKYQFKVQENGSYEIQVNYGESELVTHIVDVNNIDKKPPTISTPVISNPDKTEPSKTVMFTASDDKSGIQSVTVTLGSKNITVNNNSSFTATENGVYEISVKDKAGNMNTIQFEITKIGEISNEKPTINKIEPTSNPPFDKATVYFEIEENGNIINNVEIMSGESVSKDGKRYYFTASEPKQYTVKISYASSVLTQPIKVSNDLFDTSNPVINVISDGPQVKFTVTDPDSPKKSGIKQVSVDSIPDGELQKLVEGTYTFTGTAGKTYTIRAEDNAGNKNTEVVTIPAASPTVSINDSNIPYTKDQPITVPFTVTNQGSNELKVSPTDGASISGSQLIITKNGTYTLSAGDAKDSITIKQFDTTAPEIEIPTPSTGWAQQKVVKFTITDTQSGVDSASIKVTGPTGQPVTHTGSNGSYSFTATVEGTYTVKATDKVGNSKDNVTVAISQIDKAAPSAPSATGLKLYDATQPAASINEITRNPISISADAANATAGSPVTYSYTFGEVNETIALASPNYTATIPIPSTAQDNFEYTLKLIAKDAAGNESSKVYHVKIKAPEATTTPEQTEPEETTQPPESEETLDLTE